ncbi:type II toxin-antitoxin system VapC family toxin [Cellvibrio sp. PSBB023]|uniref:type II toxin-antitoxin system VapC family toxin n=1 Tax=Cellvibrio sp. PSBB023 TaxID=1945512 RepID=UPI00098FA405|nr:type II toxin-antitoxin system VapC family toxin [Cellvibrio sp. PSBB023]AQT61885.1 VapC toxin family PIN domain ribonuclease [Cellvibrio sp. PSBB023]
MYLLDTNVVSELRKVYPGKAHPNVKNWFSSIDGADVFLSVITLQELEIGVLLLERKDSRQGEILRAWVEGYVIPTFNENLLDVSREIALASARYYIPNPRPARDALIAATAEVHKMTIVTRNTADFEGLGVKILNPWL